MSVKKILVLKASARKNGNSELLADALIRGAKRKGHSVTEFHLPEMKIAGCRACNGCWNSQGNCVVKDDFKKLEPELEKADVLVMATPMYWSLFPAQMKAPMDRMYSYDPIHGGKHLHIGESVLLTCGETESEEDFDHIKSVFQVFSEFNGMKVVDMICVPKVNYKGDIQGNDALRRAEELGEAL